MVNNDRPSHRKNGWFSLTVPRVVGALAVAFVVGSMTWGFNTQNTLVEHGIFIDNAKREGILPVAKQDMALLQQRFASLERSLFEYKETLNETVKKPIERLDESVDRIDKTLTELTVELRYMRKERSGSGGN